MAPRILLPSRGHSSGREGIQFLGNVLIKLIYFKKNLEKAGEKTRELHFVCRERDLHTWADPFAANKTLQGGFSHFFWEGFSEPGWNFSSKTREGGQNEPHVVAWGVTAPSPSLLRCVPPQRSLPPRVSFAQSSNKRQKSLFFEQEGREKSKFFFSSPIPATAAQQWPLQRCHLSRKIISRATLGS